MLTSTTCQPCPPACSQQAPVSSTPTACLQGAALLKTDAKGELRVPTCWVGGRGTEVLAEVSHFLHPLPPPQPLTGCSGDLSHTPASTLQHPPGELRGRLHLPILSASGMALTVDVVGPAPWGFRISGGRDFHTPIVVTKVSAGPGDGEVPPKSGFLPCLSSPHRHLSLAFVLESRPVPEIVGQGRAGTRLP